MNSLETRHAFANELAHLLELCGTKIVMMHWKA